MCPQLPKAQIATVLLRPALGGRGSGYVHSTDGQTEGWSPEEPGEERGTEESRMEFKFPRPWCLGGFFCALSSPLGPGWDLLPATPPSTKAAGPGLLHLGPWKSPKQELGEELLVILSKSHLVCIACGALSNRFWLRDPGGGGGRHPPLAPPAKGPLAQTPDPPVSSPEGNKTN